MTEQAPTEKGNGHARAIFLCTTALWWVFIAVLVEAEGGLENAHLGLVLLGALGPVFAVYVVYSGAKALMGAGILTARRLGISAGAIALLVVMGVLFQAFRYETIRKSDRVVFQRDRLTNEWRLCGREACTPWRD